MGIFPRPTNSLSVGLLVGPLLSQAQCDLLVLAHKTKPDYCHESHRSGNKTNKIAGFLQRVQRLSPITGKHEEGKKHDGEKRTKMGISSLLNLPIQLLMPSSFSPIKEISLKTIPSASKIDIKRVLEGTYGIEVDKVRTLNMKGKKKNGGWFFTVKPDYKKAYVTLKRPLSTSQVLFPRSSMIKE